MQKRRLSYNYTWCSTLPNEVVADRSSNRAQAQSKPPVQIRSPPRAEVSSHGCWGGHVAQIPERWPNVMQRKGLQQKKKKEREKSNFPVRGQPGWPWRSVWALQWVRINLIWATLEGSFVFLSSCRWLKSSIQVLWASHLSCFVRALHVIVLNCSQLRAM